MKARILTGSLALLPEANALAVQGNAELLAKGLNDSRMQVSQSDQCVLLKVYVDRDLVPAGIITFTVDSARAFVWVQLSYVVEQYRGQGIYRMMYEAVRAIAKAHRCRSIEGATHVKNTAMRSVAKKMGRREEFVMLVDDIEIEPEEPVLHLPE